MADYAELYSLRSEDRIQNLLRLGEALHRVGTPAHQLEEALTTLALRLGIQAQFFSSPTALFARIDSETHAQTHLIRVEPGNVDLEKLCRLDELMQSLTDNELSLSEVTPELDAIEDAPPRYGWKSNLLAYSVTSAAATCFFGGTARDFLAAGILGLFVGLILRVAQLKQRVGLMVYPVAGIAVAFLSHLSALQFQTTVYVVSLSSLVVLLPGLSLTLAISELATRNLISGTSRLTGAFMALVSLGFGVGLGTKLFVAMFGALPEIESGSAPLFLVGAALLVSPATFMVLFGARPRAFFWIFAASALAYLCARIGAATMGPELGAFLGSFALGVASNGLARWRRHPTSLTLVPGLIMLVPGSLGFQSLSALLNHNVVSGMEAAFFMLMVGVSIVTGLLMANAVISPRKAL